MASESWLALVDISFFLSGNIKSDSKYYSLLRQFEEDMSHTSHMTHDTSYDFDFGTDMRKLVRSAGFTVIYENDNVTDAELNFNGPASPSVLANWKARLERLSRLKSYCGDDYPDLCGELINSLESREHSKNSCVKFIVAKKIVK